MEDTSGFYKQNEDLIWQYAPNFVDAPTYTLLKELKDTYTYPVDGWTWYDEQPYVTIEEPSITTEQPYIIIEEENGNT